MQWHRSVGYKRTFFVTGCLLSLTSAETTIQLLNRSAVLLKEKDIVLTNENWCIGIDLYYPTQKIISKVTGPTFSWKARERVFSNFRTRPDKTLLETLEWKRNFQQILPRQNPRRGLVNFGGNDLVSIWHSNDCQRTQIARITWWFKASYSDVARSLLNQFTCIKKFDSFIDLNGKSITNLSSIVKDVVIQSH